MNAALKPYSMSDSLEFQALFGFTCVCSEKTIRKTCTKTKKTIPLPPTFPTKGNRVFALANTERRKGRHFPHKRGSEELTRPHQRPRPGRVFARANTERRKGRHFPHKGGREGEFKLRYGVMVALQILALSVRVRVLLSQQNLVSDQSWRVSSAG